jgi:hypothetical protein
VTPEIFTTKKDLARVLKRSPRYVRDMELLGFELPCTIDEAVIFIRQNPFPSRVRRVLKAPVR